MQVASALQNSPGAVLVANLAATNATTNLTAATFTAAPNTLRAGQVYRATSTFTFLHTAAATPTLTVELVFGGTVIVAAAITPISTAATYQGLVQCYFTVRTIGATGTVLGSLHCDAQGLTQAADWGGGAVDATADTVNTTISRVVELRMRMTTAVASNTLTVTQGWWDRLVG